MKKFITLIFVMAITLVSVNAYAQLNTMSHEEMAGYKTVWEAPMGYGEIRYFQPNSEDPNGHYVLLGSTNNKYENTMATIELGKDKESALLTLEDIRKIVHKETELPKEGFYVKGARNKTTTHIYRTINGVTLKSDNAAGESFVLWIMRKRFDEAKDAIKSFTEEL